MNQEDIISKELIKKHKGNIIVDAKDLVKQQRKVIPISPSIDINTGGGIIEGSWVILSGPPKCGKTVTALQIAANAQNLYNKFVYFMAPEGRIQPRDLLGIKNFNPDLCKIIQSEEGAILTAEDYLNDGMTIIKSHPGCILIIDSASALCSAGEFSKDITSAGRADGPKLLASFCRQMGGIVPAQKVCVIIIQHLIANTSGYGPAYMEDGGRKITYQVDTKLRCKTVQKWLEGEKKQIGNILEWEVVCSPLGPPGKRCESYLRFGHGLDEEMELIVVGSDLGLISRAGAWYTTDWLDEKQKFQGQEPLRQFLVDNKSARDALYQKIKEMV